MNKRKEGYIFTFDVLIGIIIILLGLYVISDLALNERVCNSAEGFSIGLNDIFKSMKTEDFCTFDSNSICQTCSIPGLNTICSSYNYIEKDQDMLSLFALLYAQSYPDYKDEIEGIIDDMQLSGQFLASNYEYDMIIYDTNLNQLGLLYNSSEYDKSDRCTFTKFTPVVGFYENAQAGSYHTYGPFFVSVRLWVKE